MTQFSLMERNGPAPRAVSGRARGRQPARNPRARTIFFTLFCILAAGLLAPAGASAGAGHVVLVVIDGPRHTEFLDEPGLPHAPVLGAVLAPAGTRIAGFTNRNQTVTMVGHGTLVTGTAQALANDGTQRPDRPTLFELIREERGLPRTAVRLVAGKTKIAAVAYSTDPAYGETYGAEVDVATRHDPETYQAAVAAVTADPRPVFTLVNLASVDYAGHSGVWEDYLAALARADSLVGELWNVIESDSVLAGDTDLFVVADHGRHDDAHGGFTSHGDDCPGCRTLPFVALGPDIRSGLVSGRARVQEDVAPTIASILGLAAPPMEGWVMQEILVGGQVGVPSVPPPRMSLRAWPNPFRGAVTVAGLARGLTELRRTGDGGGLEARRTGDGEAFDVLRAGGVAAPIIEVFDVTGRRVVSAKAVPAWPWRWDGRDDAGRAVPPGVYWIRARSTDGAEGAVRAVKVR